MNHFRLAFAALSLLATAVGSAQAPVTPHGAAEAAYPTLHLRGGLWFDGSRFVRMDWYAVKGKFTRRKPSKIELTVDLRGKWIIPPLAEAHNHDLQNAYFAAQSAPAYMARGIFYSAQMCGNPRDLAPFRGFLNKSATPEVVFADACISSSDGHPLGIALNGAKAAGIPLKASDVWDKGYWSVDSLQDLDDRWPQIVDSKPALIKVILIDSANHKANRDKPELRGFNGLDPKLIPEVVRRARAAGSRVAAHVDTGEDFANAVSSGVDIVAHLPGYRIAKGKIAADYLIPQDAVEAAARQGVKVITTTAASKYHIGAKPGDAAAINEIYAKNISRLRAAGVTLLIGSDAIDGSVLDELDKLDRLKVISRTALLALATTDTPKALFPSRNIGRFAEGAEASLVALPGNPLVDLKMLRRPVILIKQGTILAQP